MFSAGLWCISHFMLAVADFSLNNILFSLSNLHELHLQTIRLGNKPMAYIKSLS